MSATSDGTDAVSTKTRDANGLWVIAGTIDLVCDTWADDSPLTTHFRAWAAECRAEAQRLLLEEQGSDAVLRIVGAHARSGRN